MNYKHYLHIAWSKAFNEIYCHHASLFIPLEDCSLFPPDLIYVGVSKREKILGKDEKKDIDTRIANYLPASLSTGGLIVQLNSSPIIEALSLNSWTTFKTGDRKELKEFPINIFYSIDSGKETVLPFNWADMKTPFLLIEKELENIPEGKIIESKIEFDL